MSTRKPGLEIKVTGDLPELPEIHRLEAERRTRSRSNPRYPGATSAAIAVSNTTPLTVVSHNEFVGYRKN